VNISDIYRHFAGCVKVKIKRHRTTPHLKYAIDIIFTTVDTQYLSLRYAFVLQRTSQEAERNFHRPIDFYLLGPECRVNYANDYSTFASNHQGFDKKKVVISQIPSNVSENDLRRLFANCHILKYCPARTVQLAATTTQTKGNSKILLGYEQLVS
jgi:hypothetical protein